MVLGLLLRPGLLISAYFVCENPFTQKLNNLRNNENLLTQSINQSIDNQDPARPEVAEAMKQCQEAGVRVIVITGDSRDTAVAIAKDVHIFRENEVRQQAFRFYLEPRAERLY